MLSCKEVTRIVASDELAGAGWRRRQLVRFHIFFCRHCRRYAAQMRAIGQSARKLLGFGSEEPEAIRWLERAILQHLPDVPKDSTGGGKDPEIFPGQPGEPDSE